MAMIHVNRGATNLGAFSEEDVREGLRAGRFQATDLGWHEGMASWKPLSQFPEFGGTPTAPPAQAAVVSASTPSGGGAPAASAEPRSGLPWEHRKERGFFGAFIDTLMMALTKPGTAFSVMRTEGGLGDPLLYAVIGGSFGYVIYLLFMMLVPSMAFLGDRNNALAGVFGMGAGMIFAIIVVPIALAAGVFIGSGILHLCLMIVGGAKQGFETTFRVVCFSIGSTYPLIIVPFCGGMVAGIWAIVLQCIGIARAHEIETGRATLAVLLPIIVCCGGGLLLGFMFGGMAALQHNWNQ